MAPPDVKKERSIEELTFTVLFLLRYEAQSTRQNFHLLQKVLTCTPEPKVLREFINVLGNSMRIKEIYSMLMTVKEQTDEELSSALNLLSDKMIGE